VTGVALSQRSKETSYGRLGALLAERAIVQPRHEELIRQVGGISARPTPSGGLRIGARLELTTAAAAASTHNPAAAFRSQMSGWSRPGEFCGCRRAVSFPASGATAMYGRA